SATPVDGEMSVGCKINPSPVCIRMGVVTCAKIGKAWSSIPVDAFNSQQKLENRLIVHLMDMNSIHFS
ncbi:hypothetical protein Q6247_27405, partial [Klebsiella pneumoniae]